MLTQDTEHHRIDQTRHQAILPIMTAIFVDGLGPEPRRVRSGATLLRDSMRFKGSGRIMRLPITPDPFPDLSQTRGETYGAKFPPGSMTALSGGNQTARQGRALIGGISHHFNNILMGIWGNMTLIRTQLNPKDPLYERIVHVEDLIQSGAFLIHMVLGYLCERRGRVRKIRLNQLITEIRGNTQPSLTDVDSWNFEERLKWASRIQRPRMVAGSTARVLDALFHTIDSHCREMISISSRDHRISTRLTKVETLVHRGLTMTRQLRFYACDWQQHFSRVRLTPLVKQLLRQLRETAPDNLMIHLETSKKMKSVMADRCILAEAIWHVLTNACQAMTVGGKLEVSVKPMQEELAKERCGVQKGSDYMVISIQDSGEPVSLKIRQRMFEPFFTHPKDNARQGLGLAAADGILKSHNGYILVQTYRQHGNTFKLYLPSAGTAAMGQTLR
ncbi:MAG: hypothetical protein KJP07_19125 [Desulfatitalea sp.]|nr:hypothetical protein [Desulfatitalea sp.]